MTDIGKEEVSRAVAPVGCKVPAADLQALIARLETATTADRELDARIGAAFRILPPKAPNWAATDNWGIEARDLGFDGWRVCLVHGNGGAGLNWKAEFYSGSIDAAVALAERVLSGWSVTVGNHYSYICDTTKPNAQISRLLPNGLQYDGETAVSVSAATMPLALCLAVCRALQQAQPSPQVSSGTGE